MPHHGEERLGGSHLSHPITTGSTVRDQPQSTATRARIVLYLLHRDGGALGDSHQCVMAYSWCALGAAQAPGRERQLAP